jgi:gamma-glutamyltranspeptidase/glutathione hydrolase
MVGQILKILEIYDLAGYRPSSPEYIHVFSEAAKLAFADRAQHLGDPAFSDVPGTLLAGGYLKWRRDLIDKEYAVPAARISAGVPPDKGDTDQTTHFSVCDAQGNMVAVTHTINTSYGSKLVVDGAGFLLNNERDDFSAKPGFPNTYGLVGGDANKIEPGKRMLSSMAPTLVLKKGRPYLVLGSPGGSKIITTVAEALINAVRFGSHPKQVAEQPRFHHQWLPDELYLEEGAFDINVIQELIRRGHNVIERAPYGDLQMVVIDEHGMMIPISDPRGRGTADGVN